MKNDFTSAASWNSAALAGLVLAAITLAFTFLQGLAGNVEGVVSGLLGIVAWLAKLAACVVAFRWFLIRFHDKFSGVDYTRLKNYGLKIGLFSSILVSGYTLLEMLVLNPDQYKEAINSALEPMMAQLDSNTLGSLDQMMGQLPTYSFCFSLLYCFLWGWVLSVIFAKVIEPANPFQNDNTQNTDIQ